jgi:hypothetical protein
MLKIPAKWLLAFCGLLVVVVSSYFVLLFQESADKAEHDFIIALQRRDWGALYRQSPKGVHAPSVSEAEFIRLMEFVSRGVTDRQLENVKLEHVASQHSNESRGEDHIFLTFPNTVNHEGKPVQHMTGAMRDREGWRIPVNWLPLRFAEMQAPTREEYWTVLGSALKASGIGELRSGVGATTISPERIDGFLAGRFRESEIYSR